MNQLEKVSRILPLLLADGELNITVPLKWTLPARSEDFAEPELVVLDTKAVALDGELCVHLLLRQDTYYVDAASGLVGKSASRHRVTQLFPVPGIAPGNDVEISAQVSLQGPCRARAGGERDGGATLLDGDCRVKLSYTVFERQQVTFLHPTESDAGFLSEKLTVESFCGRSVRVLDLNLPVEFGEIPQSMGRITAGFTNGKASVFPGWVKVEGEVTAAVSYYGENGRPLEETFVFPIRRYLETPESAAGMTAGVSAGVEIFTCLREQGNKTGALRGLLSSEIRLFRLEELEVATAVRHDRQVFPAGTFLLEEVIGFGSSQTLIEREIVFIRPARKVRKPVDAQVRNLTHEVIPGKVIVRGVLHKQLYIVEAATGVVLAQDIDESFVHFVDVPGVSPGMRVKPSARVEFVEVDINPGGETGRQVTIIEIRVKVTLPVKKDLLVKPCLQPAVSVLPAVQGAGTTYVVRSGDSIWKIAQMFHVSMQAIIAANNLADPSLIFPGQQLLIPR
jgi:hypothetical protein